MAISTETMQWLLDCDPALQADGTWTQTTPLAGRTWFPVDVGEGHPSRWLTLIGTRVLEWAGRA